MALICPNGHPNDEGNRFCDQCGAPLPQAGVDSSPAVTTSGAAATASSIACPVCGQENVPGTAFCDNCGAALPSPQPVASPDGGMATNGAASAAAGSAASGGSASQTVSCSQCGTPNDAANRFCDTCGATLAQGAASPALDNQSAPSGSQGDVGAAGGVMEASTALPTEGTTMPALTEEPATSTAASIPAAAPASSTAHQAATAGNAGGDAERQRLEETIATQRRMVEQLEQMQQQFGEATPAAIRQGLDEARANLSRAEAELDALTGSPAEGEGSGTLGTVATVAAAATVAAVAAAAVRSAATSSENEAAPQAPTSSTPAPTSDAPTVPAGPSQSVPAASNVSPSPQSITQPPSMPVVMPAQRSAPDQAQAAPAQPQVSGPRLLTRDFKHISLPRGGGEVVVGREDPISGIHPEVDLTPFGGEAGGVSRRHAVLHEQNGQWTLTDLDSTNYTRIDGTRVPPNTPTPLHDGARVQFGRVELEFRAS